MIIKKLNTDEVDYFKQLIDIFIDVFENENPKPSDEYLSKILLNPDFFVIVAIENGKVMGGLSVYILHTCYSEKPVAYIYDVGVKPIAQGKGIGKSLINYLCEYCKENGYKDAYVEAETEDIEAVNFYKKTNFSSELNATHFTYNFD